MVYISSGVLVTLIDCASDGGVPMPADLDWTMHEPKDQGTVHYVPWTTTVASV
jgi:hypothetical protein